MRFRYQWDIFDDGQDRKPFLDCFVSAIKISAVLWVHGIIVVLALSTFNALTALRDYLDPRWWDRWAVDFAKKEVVYPEHYSQFIKDATWYVHIVDILRHDLVFFGFWPIVVCCYLQMNFGKSAVFFTVIMGIAAFLRYVEKFFPRNMLHLIYFQKIVPLFATLAYLRLVVFGKPSTITKNVGKFIVTIVSLGQLIMFTASLFGNSLQGRLVFFLVIMPLFKEGSTLLAKQASWYLTYKDLGETDVERQQTFPFFLVMQTFFAIYIRVQIVNFGGESGLLALIVATQSAAEIILRLTVPWRDRMFRSLRKRFCSRRRSKGVHVDTIVVDPTSIAPNVLGQKRVVSTTIPASWIAQKTGDGISMTSSVEQFNLSRRAFLTQTMLFDQLSEVLGIVGAFVMIYFGKNNILDRPYQYYTISDDPFGRPIDMGPLIQWFFGQLVAEFCVDVFCAMIEQRHGYDIQLIYSIMPKGIQFHFLLGITVYYAFLLARVAVFVQDDFSKCMLDNMCKCANGNGLQLGAIRERYCQYLYPDTGGYPPPE